MTAGHILIVEDEVKIAALLSDYFQSDGFTTHEFHTGEGVVEWCSANQVDAILLDLMLPAKDGMTICREIRRVSDVPILMVTARVEEIDRLLGLELGADDFICKPFSPREVVARVKAVLRRVRSNMVPEVTRPWLLDDGRYEFEYLGARVALTAAEFGLLGQLCEDPGRIFSRGQLMQVMYTDNRVVSERTVDSHVKKLRAKLAGLAGDTEFVESVYGIGYRFLL